MGLSAKYHRNHSERCISTVPQPPPPLPRRRKRRICLCPYSTCAALFYVLPPYLGIANSPTFSRYLYLEIHSDCLQDDCRHPKGPMAYSWITITRKYAYDTLHVIASHDRPERVDVSAEGRPPEVRTYILAGALRAEVSDQGMRSF